MHARIALLAVLLGTGTCAHAQKHCETLIALSKTVSSVVSGRSSVEQNAQNFCSEYARTTSSSRSTSFGASYKFLSLSLGNSGASADEVASKYCSASSGYATSSDAYRRYIETIAPNAYSAYEKCLNSGGLTYDIDLGSILPAQFSMSISYVSPAAGVNSAALAYSASSGIRCKWNGSNNASFTLPTGSRTILDCSRDDQTRPGYVKVINTRDSSDPLTLPWQAYSREGVPVATLADLQHQISSVQSTAGDLGKAVSELSAQLAARKVATNYVESFSTMVRYHDQCNSAAAAYNDQLPGAAAAQNLCRARGFTGGIPQQALGDNFGFVCVM